MVTTPTRAWEFSYPRSTRSVGVHFKPWGLAPFLPMPAAEMCDRPTTVEEIWGRSAIADLRQRLATADGPHELLTLLEEELVRELTGDRTVEVAAGDAGGGQMFAPAWSTRYEWTLPRCAGHTGAMAGPRTIPLLPCADIDEIATFFGVIDFEVTYRQLKPYACLALAGHGFDLQYYGLDGHRPEESHSSCLVIVEDTGPIWEDFAARMREEYGKLPVSGFPRITRPRPRKNAGGLSGFSLVDPAGNWIRFFRGGETEEPDTAVSKLGAALRNAVVLADSKGDVTQAAKILRGAVKRAPADDPSVDEAQSFLTELDERLDG